MIKVLEQKSNENFLCMKKKHLKSLHISIVTGSVNNLKKKNGLSINWYQILIVFENYFPHI